MGSEICMNEGCRAKSSSVWKKGWTLKSGGSATLCYNCGSAYEKFLFCETFHLEETGWRDCRLCGKGIHCGCIASKLFHELLDFGGVACTSCLKHLDSNSRKSPEIPNFETPKGTAIEGVPPPIAMFDKPTFLRAPRNMDSKETEQLFMSREGDTHASVAPMSGYEVVQREFNTHFPTLLPHSFGSSVFVKPSEQSRQTEGAKDVYEPLPSLNFFPKSPISAFANKPPFPDEVVESTELNKVSSCQQGQKARQIFPKPTKVVNTLSSEVSNGIAAQARVARPPSDGKGRSQLLPRYWPRITDEELQQLSGDLKSTVVPLFEKILSASDAGRIGRLVLPKACAELYFPTINQSDGLPIRMQDVTGKEWTFQFRFWPNNNSRMYVLEGVTPCIQNLQLEAGDTVTFSRIEPGGQLVIGFRKSTNNAGSEEPQAPLLLNGVSSGETPIGGANENMIQNGHRNSEDSLQNTSTPPEKKKARHIGSKNKRLRMHKDDAMELRLTWEEAQDLLRPPPAAKPTIVKIEDYEFEEYEEAPVFGKRSVFTANLAGDQAQWAQCDSCKKWRKVPVDILLPARWTCSDNIWDANKCSCFADDEMIPWVLDPFNKESKGLKKRRSTEENKPAEVCEPSGLDALATAAFLGDNVAVLAAEPSSGGVTTTTTTTKHPRHRPGCTCIVCIQPPSGKGKHTPSCKCSACNSMKRRFRTLMLKKKRKQQQPERRGGEVVFPREKVHAATTAEVETMAELMNLADGERSFKNKNRGDDLTDIPESSKGKLDLNCQPSREDDMLAEATAGLNMTTIINVASFACRHVLEAKRPSQTDQLLADK